jgi:hypothetical protein
LSIVEPSMEGVSDNARVLPAASRVGYMHAAGRAERDADTSSPALGLESELEASDNAGMGSA